LEEPNIWWQLDLLLIEEQYAKDSGEEFICLAEEAEDSRSL